MFLQRCPLSPGSCSVSAPRELSSQAGSARCKGRALLLGSGASKGDHAPAMLPRQSSGNATGQGASDAREDSAHAMFDLRGGRSGVEGDGHVPLGRQLSLKHLVT
ncbi:unnamed protein product [Prorocentrum cordatum]|uniref:Uncharacterized protein n=1 Tax=Prorocentrum cordatum TaxID=2364126 RepID=A0ABN9PG42_9DINO|nr:unnamed protein product [Polarella glacialis]